MCTVTFLPMVESDFILTSSRDVPYDRESASAPKKYHEDDIDLWYPKDGKAGGTWLGLSEHKRLICLLNGGFEYHTSRSVYKKSRGLVVKELLKASNLEEKLRDLDLEGVEQFTLVIVDWSKNILLREFVWDGTEKHLRKLPQKPHIWSSSTLYDAGVKQMRQEWFQDWQDKNSISKESILDFHHNAGVGDACIDVMMDRGLGGTVSITSVSIIEDQISINYKDIRTKKRTLLEIF